MDPTDAAIAQEQDKPVPIFGANFPMSARRRAFRTGLRRIQLSAAPDLELSLCFL